MKSNEQQVLRRHNAKTVDLYRLQKKYTRWNVIYGIFLGIMLGSALVLIILVSSNCANSLAHPIPWCVFLALFIAGAVWSLEATSIRESCKQEARRKGFTGLG